MEFPGRSKLLGEYQLGKTIGQGAFSKVKLGYHRESGQKVAIKIVDKKMMADKAKKSKDAHEERERRMKGKERKEDHTQDKRGGPQSGSKKETVSSHHNQSDPDSSMVGTQFRQESSVGHETMAPDSQIPQTEREPQPDFVSKLQPEVQLMLRLDHPHIVKVFQVIDTEDECFIVMEYAKGGELIEYIASRDHLAEKEARRFFRQIISAIDHCHLANVVHRDLKLENLLLNGERNILLSDFGLGRTFRDDLEEYMKTFCGTPNYAAVELVSGIPYVGVKSDIWAMGVVLYLMVTGKPPFYGDTISHLYKEIKAVNYKVYDTFSKELKHLLSRMLCKNPSERIDMAELRTHPWVNMDEAEPPTRFYPRISGNLDASALNQFIVGIHYEKDATIYVFRSHKKEESKGMFSGWTSSAAKQDATRVRPATVQPKKDTKNEQAGIMRTPAEEKEADEYVAPMESTGRRPSVGFQMPAFFRRISFVGDRASNPMGSSRTSMSSSEKGSSKLAPTRTDSPSIDEVKPAEKSPAGNGSSALAPAPAQSATMARRHSNIGPGLTIPEDSTGKARRASGTGIMMGLTRSPTSPPSGSQTVNPKPASHGFQLMPALSAMLRKSTATINSSHQGSTDVGPAMPPEPRQAIPSDTLRPHFVRSSSFNSAVTGAPKIHLEPEDTLDIGSPGHSPLPRKASSIRTIRRASQSPALEKRSSFGAPQEITATMAVSPVSNRGRPFLQTNAPSLAVPGGGSLLSPSGKRSDISRSHNAFTSDAGSGSGGAQSMFKAIEHTGRSLSTHGHRDIARSAILSGLGQPVDDDEKLGTTFTSHDMMSTNSKWTDRDDSYPIGSSNETTESSPREIQEWHELHRAPKVIRSMRFSFNTATSSTMEPGEIFKRLHRALKLLSKQYENRFQFQRQNPDYLQLTCRLLPNSRNSTEPPLLFEVEVCKVWLLNLHGIRIKRIAGNPIMFKEIFGFVESELKI